MPCRDLLRLPLVILVGRAWRLWTGSGRAPGCGWDSEPWLVSIALIRLPFLDHGAFFPGDGALTGAEQVWARAEELGEEADDLYGGGFVEAYRDHYHLTAGGRGQHYERRLRVAEKLSIQRGHGPCESGFSSDWSKSSWSFWTVNHAYAALLSTVQRCCDLAV